LPELYDRAPSASSAAGPTGARIRVLSAT